MLFLVPTLLRTEHANMNWEYGWNNQLDALDFHYRSTHEICVYICECIRYLDVLQRFTLSHMPFFVVTISFSFSAMQRVRILKKRNVCHFWFLLMHWYNRLFGSMNDGSRHFSISSPICEMITRFTNNDC